MKLLGILLALTTSVPFAHELATCGGPDPELLTCPIPQAPRVTELRSGKVTLELSIATDGSLESSRVISSSGHAAWVGAAQAAVLKWHYSPGAVRKRSVPFDFHMGGD